MITKQEQKEIADRAAIIMMELVYSTLTDAINKRVITMDQATQIINLLAAKLEERTNATTTAT
ncbi:MAG: hypothetical protein QW478_08815 [Candidatus Micrarchaeaceae archaeon]